MTAITEERPAAIGDRRADRPTHLACPTYPHIRRAICGWVKPSGEPPRPRDSAYCVVCLDLAHLPCPDCGEYHHLQSGAAA